MAEDRLDAIRRKVESLREPAAKEVAGKGIRLAAEHGHQMGPRTDGTSDAVRDRHRHIDDHKSADLMAHTSAGHGHTPRSSEQEKDRETSQGESKKLSPEQAKAILGESKVPTSIRAAKESEGQRAAPPEQEKRRAGRER